MVDSLRRSIEPSRWKWLAENLREFHLDDNDSMIDNSRTSTGTELETSVLSNVPQESNQQDAISSPATTASIYPSPQTTIAPTATSATLLQPAIVLQTVLAPASTLVPITNPAPIALDEVPDHPSSTRPPKANQKAPRRRTKF